MFRHHIKSSRELAGCGLQLIALAAINSFRPPCLGLNLDQDCAESHGRKKGADQRPAPQGIRQANGSEIEGGTDIDVATFRIVNLRERVTVSEDGRQVLTADNRRIPIEDIVHTRTKREVIGKAARHR